MGKLIREIWGPDPRINSNSGGNQLKLCKNRIINSIIHVIVGFLR